MNLIIKLILPAVVCATSTALAQKQKAAEKIPSNVEMFSVRTSVRQDAQVLFYLRKPTKFDPSDKKTVYRLLFICPYLRATGLQAVRGEIGCKELIDLAEQRQWFVLAPTFKMAGNVHNRQTFLQNFF